MDGASRRTRSRWTLASLAFVAGCGSGSIDDPREAAVVGALERADDSFLRARPELVAGKYALMTSPGISFFRGSLPLYLYDWQYGSGGLGPSAFDLEVPLVPSIGDPHPENFGTLLAPDGTVAVELDDFDTADRAPYLLDVRRFAAGMALAAHLANAGDAAANALTSAAAEAIATAGAMGYAEGIEAAASGHPPARLVAPTGNAFLDSLLSKAAMAAIDREELTEDTVRDATGRHLRRGVLDPTDPQNVYGELPDFAYAALPAVFAEYRQTLIDPPPPEFFTVLDAVREFGAGVSSWPKLRAIVLLRGATDDPSDDQLVEVKELTDSGIAGLYPPGVYADDVVQRDLLLSRHAWARPDADPLWGGSHWEGFPVQIRHESEAARGVKVDNMNGALGTVAVITDLASRLGQVLARLHVAALDGEPSAVGAIWSRLRGDVPGFAREQGKVGAAYALQAIADRVRFQNALQTLGPRLGLPLDTLDAPPPDEAALLGTPPMPLSPTPPSP